MRSIEEREVTLNLEMSQAERIETAFRHNNREIARLFENAIREGYSRDLAGTQRAQDPAKLPIAIKLTYQQARTIANRYRGYLDSPTDQKIYAAIEEAIGKSGRE